MKKLFLLLTFSLLAIATTGSANEEFRQTDPAMTNANKYPKKLVCNYDVIEKSADEIKKAEYFPLNFENKNKPMQDLMTQQFATECRDVKLSTVDDLGESFKRNAQTLCSGVTFKNFNPDMKVTPSTHKNVSDRKSLFDDADKACNERVEKTINSVLSKAKARQDDATAASLIRGGPATATQPAR